MHRRPVLVCVVGQDQGKRARVGGSSFTIGRSHGADLTLDDPRISSRHCRIEDRGDGWALMDLGSTNGTFVNGEQADDRVLVANDKIELGDTVLRFELQDAADAAYDEHVQRMIHVDDLTGLYLRRRFDHELSLLLSAAARGGGPLGLLVMDLDGLKQINDANGHLFGAYVIAQSGRLIGETIPQGAIAARFGGDEYTAALPAHDLAQTQVVANAILEAIRDYPFEYDGVRLRPGISVGCAVYPDHAPDAERLFRSADAALYSAKRGGKGRVSVA